MVGVFWIKQVGCLWVSLHGQEGVTKKAGLMQSSDFTANTPRSSVTKILSKLEPLLSGPRPLSTSQCECTGARMGGVGVAEAAAPGTLLKLLGCWAPPIPTPYSGEGEKPQIFVANGI